MKIELLDIAFSYYKTNVYFNVNLSVEKPQNYLVLGKKWSRKNHFA
ncbi:hypothetical protein [Borrelia duttonii]